MRPVKFLSISTAVVAGLLLAAACGSDQASPEKQPTTAVSQPTSAVTTTAPIATVAPTSARLGITSVDDLVNKAPRFAPYELDNVRYGGTFIAGTSSSVLNWDPKFAPNAFGDLSWVYDRLVPFVANENDQYSRFGPGLAESWTISPDFKNYTFNLRKGVTFHNVAPVNGREFTSDDAVFSYRRYAEKDSTAFSGYAQVESIDALDKYTVVFKLKTPNAWALEDLFRNFQSVISRETLEQPGGIGNVPIGTGAYIVKNYAPRIVGQFVRNPNYWGKDQKGNPLPYTDEIKLIYITDPATSLAAMRSGQLDMGSSSTPEDNVALLKSNPDRRVFGKGDPIGTGIAFNTTKKPWDDVRVRRAIRMSLDKVKMGQAYIAYDNPDHWFWAGSLPWRAVSDQPFNYKTDYGPYDKYDAEAARRLLIEAGFPDGKMTIENPFTFPNSVISYVRIATLLQAGLKTNGIDMSVQGSDLSAWTLYNATRTLLVRLRI